MSADVKAIEDALAWGPTPGPWRVGEPTLHRVWPYIMSRSEVPVCAVRSGSNRPIARRNAAYIAACSPDRMRRLLDERAQMVEALQWYAAMSKRMGNAAISQDSQAILTLMKDVAVDYGGRARAALARAEGGE